MTTVYQVMDAGRGRALATYSEKKLAKEHVKRVQALPNRDEFDLVILSIKVRDRLSSDLTYPAED